MSARSLSEATLSVVLWRLRLANAHYLKIAREFRCQLRFTHHAKMFAQYNRLRIDICKAKECARTAISVKPLPILDLSPSPTYYRHTTTKPQRASLEGRRNSLKKPKILVSAPGTYSLPISPLMFHNVDSLGYPALTIRMPPLTRREAYLGMPGAPLLKPRELPLEDIFDSSSNSSYDSSPELVTPLDLPFAKRVAKRKLDMLDCEDENSVPRTHQQYTPRRQWVRSQQQSTSAMRTAYA